MIAEEFRLKLYEWVQKIFGRKMFCKIIFSFLCFTRLFHFANIFFTDLKDMSNKGIKKTKRTIFKKEPLRRDKKSMYNIFTNININIIVWKRRWNRQKLYGRLVVEEFLVPCLKKSNHLVIAEFFLRNCCLSCCYNLFLSDSSILRSFS